MPINQPLASRRGVLLATSAVLTLGVMKAPPPLDRRTVRDKRESLYQANAPEVQTFYRVNRYPTR